MHSKQMFIFLLNCAIFRDYSVHVYISTDVEEQDGEYYKYMRSEFIRTTSHCHLYPQLHLFGNGVQEFLIIYTFPFVKYQICKKEKEKRPLNTQKFDTVNVEFKQDVYQCHLYRTMNAWESNNLHQITTNMSLDQLISAMLCACYP